MSLGKKIKFLRRKYNLTQKEMSKKINISYSSISKYENNQSLPDLETLKKIAVFFNISVDYLLDVKIEADKDIFNINSLPEEDKKTIKKFILFIKDLHSKNT